MKTSFLTIQDLLRHKQKQSNAKLDMGPFKDVLGEDLPELSLNKVGRFRLMRALRNKFGAGFKNVGIAQKLIKSFDSKMPK